MATSGYTLKQLQEMTGVPQRSLRDWIERKVLPRSLGKGRAARYSDRHVALAEALRTLSLQGVALPTARARLDQMSIQQLETIATEECRTAIPREVPLPPPDPQYPYVAWEVIELTNGMVLMVNPRHGPLVRRIADEIYRYYGPSNESHARVV